MSDAPETSKPGDGEKRSIQQWSSPALTRQRRGRSLCALSGVVSVVGVEPTNPMGCMLLNKQWKPGKRQG